ncbi:nose resistant to fluoxetine protein 6 [Tribolium castaneum]|uniref:Nose resistant to fluoxetine protein 6-like Protein n=1 Tax=Tribolium castaneum TaxID=7070 RepID=A0A139WB26_TRICA|nr:PREDICTED: nose resistant to fluoxetine protein 6-like [Tribolium castaneum]KYB25125.1 Nose resistant to fluoxetine protein 6-like Protein [Tribolium castaneum]|eukprot:XP_008199621.1 PREDICTED: nose resistant to fluoxetine protein 6-like [Tribolium castaneum]
MFWKTKIGFCFLLLTPILCDSNFTNIYDEFFEVVVNRKELSARIKTELGDSNEAIAAYIKMLDAWSKFPSGIMEGNLMDLGSFDECYAIEYNNIYGKYCLGNLHFSFQMENFFKTFGISDAKPRPRILLHPQPRLMGLGDEYTGIHFAACVPSTLPASEIPGLFNYTEEFCYSKATEPELSAGAIVTITILAIFLCIVLVSTSYDVALNYFKKEPYHELLIAFSFLHNGRKLFRSSKNSEQLLCLNGIRALSMMWVILGHEYSNSFNAPISNFFDLKTWQDDPANMFIMGATVSVDTFFTAGGLVTVYTFLKSMDKGANFNVLLFYVHRYLRLTPAYFIMGLIHLFLLNHFGTGPLWKVVDISLVDTCETGWWSSLLYITNYVQKGTCLPQAWYLQVDMQLFVLSPLVLIPLFRWPKIGLGALGFLTIMGCVSPFVIGYVKHLGGGMINNDDTNEFMNYYYAATYARFGPYVIGMLAGYLLYKIKTNKIKVNLKMWQVITLWLVLLTGLVACVWAGFPLNASKDDRWGNSLFLAFNRPAWAVAVVGVVFLCVAGYGGPIDKFLSWSVFQFLTKVSYSMYLVHFAVITVRYALLRNNIKFSNLAMMHAFWGDFMFTLGLSMILCSTFESPIIILEKYLFHRGPKTKSVKQ